MGSKNNPGAFDCFAKAHPDEPMFVLLGRDPVGWLTVVFWIAMRQKLDPDDPKLEEAKQCYREMEEWAKSKGKDTVTALAIFEEILTFYPYANQYCDPNWRSSRRF